MLLKSNKIYLNRLLNILRHTYFICGLHRNSDWTAQKTTFITVTKIVIYI